MGSVVTLGDAADDVLLADDDDSTGVGVIHQQGTISETLVSLGFGAAGFTTSDEDVRIAVGLEIPSTGTDVGGGARGVKV